MTRKAAKPGLYDTQLRSAKAFRNVVNRKKRGDRDDLMVSLADAQHGRMRYTTKGDFTNCFRRGI